MRATKEKKERKTRRVQLALQPSLYSEVLKCGRYAGYDTFTACVEAVLTGFVLQTTSVMSDERDDNV